MIKLKDVSKFYNSNGITSPALEHINLEFKRGDIVAITGESGSGKSTLLNVICGNDFYDDGEIYFYEDETSYFDISDADNFRNKYVGFIYQNYNIIESYTVLENVMFPLLLKGMKKKEAKAKATELIYKVGLKDRIKHKGTKLSGGEKQRVVIARALAQDADILACDEPTGNLDSKTAKEIIDLIKEVAKDKLVLIVTHNYEQVKDIATRKVTLVDGHVIEDKVLKEVSEKEKENLVLEEQHITKSNLLRLTWQNIFSTPKKTIYTFLVMFVMCFCILCLFQSISNSYNSAIVSNDTNLTYYGPELIYFYKENKEIFTKEEKEQLANLNYIIKYDLANLTYLSTNLDLAVYYMPLIPKEISKVSGRMPENKEEMLLLVPSAYDYLISVGENLVGNEFKVVGSAKTYTITGMATSAYCRQSIVCTVQDISSDFSNEQTSFLNLGRSDFYFSNLNLTKPDLVMNAQVSNFTLALPKGMANLYGKLYLKYYSYTHEVLYDVVYTNSNKPMLYAPINYTLEDYPTFEASLFAINFKQAIKDLKQLGFVVEIASDYSYHSLDKLATLVLLTILAIIPAIFVYLVTYLIFKAIYYSKFKEYTIMRSIGINKRNISLILLLETFLVAFSSACLSFIIEIIIGYIFNVNLFKEINSYICSIYFSLMFIFSILLALRVNKRLYFNTTAKMLKGGEQN